MIRQRLIEEATNKGYFVRQWRDDDRVFIDRLVIEIVPPVGDLTMRVTFDDEDNVIGVGACQGEPRDGNFMELVCQPLM